MTCPCGDTATRTRYTRRDDPASGLRGVVFQRDVCARCGEPVGAWERVR